MSTAYVHIGQDYLAQIKANNGISSGRPTGAGDDGIDWPYDPNGPTPNPSQFQVNWGAQDAMKQAEQAYERLIQWIRNNPGCYNAYIMLLQMTTDIGMHLGSLPPDQQQELSKFLSNQLTSQVGNQTLLQQIISIAAEAAAVSQSTEAQGEASATAFLTALANVSGSLQQYGPPFTTMYTAALFDEAGISDWCQKHFQTFTDPSTGVQTSTWIDDNGNPIDSFSAFTSMAAFSMGTFLGQTDADQTIDAYYQAEIAQLVAQFKGNPWELLIALMTLVNQRDQDNGMSVNGYGGNLTLLKEANGLVQKLLGDITGTPNAADFFKTLQQLRTLVEQDPALSQLVSQLESDVGTLNGQTVSFNTSNTFSYTAGPGYFTFPPGTTVSINGQKIIVPANGVVYVGESVTFTVTLSSTQNEQLTFGQLAAMGDTADIQAAMTGWTTTVMSNFENCVTGIQTLLNGASPAIQQEIQNTTQIMQTMENFEKEAYDSIVNVDQQIMKLIGQVMG